MQNGANSVIIDLRDNPGGLLSSSLDLLDLILPKNLDLVSTKGREGKKIKSYKTLNNNLIPESINLAVLINGGSASASEIVAGVLQDYDRAVVLGSQSFGKGLVQTVIGINQDNALKITNSKYFIPSGRSLQKREFIDEKLKFAKNPKCFDENGKIKKNLFSKKTNDNVEQHGLVYDMKTDMFVPIKEKDKLWKK